MPTRTIAFALVLLGIAQSLSAAKGDLSSKATSSVSRNAAGSGEKSTPVPNPDGDQLVQQIAQMTPQRGERAYQAELTRVFETLSRVDSRAKQIKLFGRLLTEATDDYSDSRPSMRTRVLDLIRLTAQNDAELVGQLLLERYRAKASNAEQIPGYATFLLIPLAQTQREVVFQRMDKLVQKETSPLVKKIPGWLRNCFQSDEFQFCSEIEPS